MDKKRKLIIMFAAIISVLYAMWCVKVLGPSISIMIGAGTEGHGMAALTIILLIAAYACCVGVPLAKYLLEQSKKTKNR